MPYPYGMYNAPVLGNGLGGLPRRATTATATTTPRKYDVQFLANLNVTSMPANATDTSIPILMNGKGLQYFANASSAFYRNVFDYSSSGIGTNTSTNTGGSSMTQLPAVSAGTNAQRNCVWSQPVGSQMLFKYNTLKPFLVTWDGTNDSSYVYPTNPSDIAVSANADAFLLPNGNLITLGNRVSFPSEIQLIEYTPALVFVRSLYLGNLTNLVSGNPYISARKTSYGYIIAATTVDSGTRADCLVVTLNNTCTTIIDTRSANIKSDTPSTSNIVSTICGQDGVMFFSQYTNTIIGSVNVPVSSTGTISTITAAQSYSSSQAVASGSAFSLNYISGGIPGMAGCNKYADAIAPAFYVAGNTGGNRSIVLSASSSGSSTTIVNYVDADIYPTVNPNLNADGVTVYSGELNRVVYGSFSVHASVLQGVNMAYDDNGFIFINSSTNTTNGKLLKRVYRSS